MMNRRTHGLLLLIAVAATSAAARESPLTSAISPGANVSDIRIGTLEELRAEASAYGDHWQWTVISPSEFMELGNSPVGSAIGVGQTNYVFPLGPGFQWMAQLELPQGARVNAICPMLYVNNAAGTWFVELLAGENADAGGTPTYHQLATIVSPAGTPGYTIPCAFPGTTFRSYADLNGDNLANPVAYQFLLTEFGGVTGADMMHAGILVVWNREVSPAPGFASYTDVPTSHPFFQFVQALSASGITAGCGGGNFCPSAPLTRGQMAVFLAKALGLHWDS